MRAALRRLLLAALMLATMPAAPAGAAGLRAAVVGTPEGDALVARLRAGGLVLFFRHADTIGMPCDRSFRIGDRDGQRNISTRGQEQARRIGTVLRDLAVPLARPILAGPVFRARDTAEIAFGDDHVQVTDDLLADDYAGGKLDQVLAGHRRLLAEAPPAGANRVLVGHRTPAIMVLGPAVGGDALPEGAALVIEPASDGPRILGILAAAPVAGGGFHGC
ncbi:phosphohistidine phosphatase SixA [Stella humosa]|uniref:Phosphohistidine phosphatase SixA n=1 Tax=Stella humosa TaxID=94 RepID=A0A3N1LGV4_9PROT|nr:histidine phosphatase family protein [Stella humosa]ROP90652.1 phosphohistidine phosphatase SixA [Stella humosa]BBK29449.1 hypothetical protein STHU_00830 [Stella humosa]